MSDKNIIDFPTNQNDHWDFNTPEGIEKARKELPPEIFKTAMRIFKIKDDQPN